MSIFSSYKKIFLLGFVIVILVAIPLSVYLVQKRQQTTVKATPATSLSFEPTSLTVKSGEIFSLGVVLNPAVGASANQVSFVKLSISFDPEKFETVIDSLKPNPDPANGLQNLEGSPAYDNTLGKASISLSIGDNPLNAVTTTKKIAILKLKAKSTTIPTSPNILFNLSPDTQVLSLASSDTASENVLLSTTNPATVTVTSEPTSITPTPIPTVVPGQAPASGQSGPAPVSGGGSLSSAPSSLGPVCSSLKINGLPNGTAPYSLSFTATGDDSDGTISKISFNFGDTIEDLISGGGIGTSSVSGQIFHTYKTPGIYTSYAILTDNNSNLSTQQAACTKIITVNASSVIIPTGSAGLPLPPTGPGQNILNLGIIGAIFTVIGGAVFILL